jgi:phosphoglycolate phosphatase
VKWRIFGSLSEFHRKNFRRFIGALCTRKENHVFPLNELEFRKPRKVAFDWDNTLVDSTLLCLEALNRVLDAYRLPSMSREEFENDPHLSTRDSFPGMFGAKAQEAEDLFVQTLRKQHPMSLRPTPGAEKLLRFLQGAEIPLAVVSNKQGELVRQEAKLLGWEHFFTHIVGSCDTPYDKPDPTPLLKVLEPGFDQQKAAFWFVGDSDVDMLCAHRAGVTGIAVGGHIKLKDVPFFNGLSCLNLINFCIKKLNNSEFSN